jgi:hypothetical protein
MKKVVLLLFISLNINSTSFAQSGRTYEQLMKDDSIMKAWKKEAPISREAEREFKHFSELATQTKEYIALQHEIDSINGSRDVERQSLMFGITGKGLGDDAYQCIFGIVQRKGLKMDVYEYYLKYDKGKRKIVSISKHPIDQK